MEPTRPIIVSHRTYSLESAASDSDGINMNSNGSRLVYVYT